MGEDIICITLVVERRVVVSTVADINSPSMYQHHQYYDAMQRAIDRR